MLTSDAIYDEFSQVDATGNIFTFSLVTLQSTTFPSTYVICYNDMKQFATKYFLLKLFLNVISRNNYIHQIVARTNKCENVSKNKCHSVYTSLNRDMKFRRYD